MVLSATERAMKQLSERDMRDFVQECDQCGDNKTSTVKHLGKLRPHMPPIRPFTRYSISM